MLDRPLNPSIMLYAFARPVMANTVNMIATRGMPSKKSTPQISSLVIEASKRKTTNAAAKAVKRRRVLTPILLVKSSVRPMAKVGIAHNNRITFNGSAILDCRLIKVAARSPIAMLMPPIRGTDSA